MNATKLESGLKNLLSTAGVIMHNRRDVAERFVQYRKNLGIMSAVLVTIFTTSSLAQTIDFQPALSGNGTLDVPANTTTIIGINESLQSFSSDFSGTINLDPSSVIAKAGPGTFTISGATIAGGPFYLLDGTIRQATGNTSVLFLSVGGNTNPFTGYPSVGSMIVSGGTITFAGGLHIGDFAGIGTVNQTGGNVILGGSGSPVSMNIGNQGGNGTYNLSGGSILFDGTGTTSFIVIGRNGPSDSATAQQPSTGVLNLHAGVLTVNNATLFIGSNGTSGGAPGSGTINQTGGILALAGDSRLFLAAVGDGTYNLLGGALQIGGGALSGPAGGTGSYSFNLGGGTIRIVDTALIANVDAKLVVGTTSTIDTDNLGASWSGSFFGGGSLNKSGLGVLVLNGKNTFTGDTIISEGAVALEGNGSLAESAKIENNGVFDLSRADIDVRIRSLSGVGDVILGDHNLVMTAANDIFYGNISGGGGVILVDGHEILKGNHTYTGDTIVAGGTLQVDGSIQRSLLTVKNSGELSGIGTVGNTTNAGTIAPGHSIGTLTVAGNYTGNGGVLQIEAVLGDDASATDRLVVSGDVSGQTDVHVINRGGSGALTTNGIEIIQIGGATPHDAFTLVGDFTTEDGQAAVIGGAYAYTLHHNVITDPTDGNWYLRSTLQLTDDEDNGEGEGPGEGEGGEELPGGPEVPRYAPGDPVYEAYPQVLQLLNAVPTLQQRVGNRYWKEAPSAAEPVFCKDPAQNFRCAPTADQNAVYADGIGNYTIENGIWGRIEGVHSRLRPDVTTSSTNYDVNVHRMQAGIDGLFYESEAGRLIGGFNVQYAHANADIGSFFGDGEISTDGYGLGGTLTWYGQSGIYLDGQVQAMWYNSDLTSLADNITNSGLANGNNGFGYALSLESGKRIEFADGWSVTPQAQLAYSSVDFDSFHDGYGTVVSLDRDNSLQVRLGLSLDKQASWTDGNGQITRSHLYGIANLYNEFLEGSRVNVAGVNFDSRNERLWGGLGLGGSYYWANDKYSVYGESSVNTSLTSFADSYTVKGTVGFKVRF